QEAKLRRLRGRQGRASRQNRWTRMSAASPPQKTYSWHIQAAANDRIAAEAKRGGDPIMGLDRIDEPPFHRARNQGAGGLAPLEGRDAQAIAVSRCGHGMDAVADPITPSASVDRLVAHAAALQQGLLFAGTMVQDRVNLVRAPHEEALAAVER